jgi:hypothetical protein
VQVRRRDEAPAEFLWRGRLYVVRDVLSHWVETDAWWRAQRPADPAGPAGPVGSADGLDDECELWRVEATAGRVHGTGVFDLSYDVVQGSWALVRTMD